RGATTAGGDDPGFVAVEHQCPDAVAAAATEEADGGGRGQGEVALGGVGGAELHRRRSVDQQPRLQLAVGDGVADMDDAAAGRERPVDLADIVARLVLASLVSL